MERLQRLHTETHTHTHQTQKHTLVEMLNFTEETFFVLLISHKEKHLFVVAHCGEAGARAVAPWKIKCTNWVLGASALPLMGPSGGLYGFSAAPLRASDSRLFSREQRGGQTQVLGLLNTGVTLFPRIQCKHLSEPCSQQHNSSSSPTLFPTECVRERLAHCLQWTILLSANCLVTFL